MKILIVEDDRDARRFLRIVGEKGFHDIIEAENGLEGLRLATEHKPDLIISDALMPVMDGFYFLREIKKHAALKDIPFIFYSATYTEQDDIRLARSMGADDYIIKPKEPEELWAEIGRALEKRKAEKHVKAVFSTPEEENEHLRRHTQIIALKLERTVAKLQEALAVQEQSEEALRLKTGELEKFFSVALDLLCITDAEGNFRPLNPAWERALGYTQLELAGRKLFELLHPDDITPTRETLAAPAARSKAANFVNRCRCKDGTYRWLEWCLAPAGKLIYAAARDITRQRQATQERDILEAKLRQAHKMEAVGRLAGGVAHDFNNLLTAIDGYANLLIKALPAGEKCRSDAEEIKKAAERAASLTQQLLAFSRKQVLAPRAIGLNKTLGGIEKMLQRLIGENFTLSFSPDPQLKSIKADSSQIDQIVMNLVLNARDAMPEGGDITLETHNVRVDSKTEGAHDVMRPGDYVQLTVTDSGCGMSAETQQHLFEPFFTTKAPGKGTGLGLATVYGIVMQSDGHIFVYSEAGIGTSVKIYFPASTQEAGGHRDMPGYLAGLRGSETVLVAEDENMVRDVVCRTLRENGYKTIETRDGKEAADIAATMSAPIHVAIIDLVMPKLGGKGLHERLRSIHPETKVIYTSGYTDNFMIRHMGLYPDTPFLQKPISEMELLEKVRQAADSTKKSVASDGDKNI
ncbi:MAG TPA: hybrid sensor histidine kinase/response regulator [Elusimicrobia bacterium]|nr:hybrid sensor histidine kinase/response regulator [Elusimicrobiota bacterium]